MNSKQTSVTFFAFKSLGDKGTGMGCLDPETRRLMVNADREGYRVSEITRIFNVSRKTVWKWCKRTMRVGRPVYKKLSKRPDINHGKDT